MATRNETINFLNKELKTLATAKGFAVRTEQSLVDEAEASRIATKVEKVVKDKTKNPV